MRYINHKIKSASAGGGTVGTKKMYGLNGGETVREGDPCRADIAINLIPKSAGVVTKRCGYTKKTLPFEYEGNINAVAIFDAYLARYTVYLIGSKLYCVYNGNVYSHTLPFDTADMRPVRLGDYQFFIGGDNLIIYYPFLNQIMYWSTRGVGGDTYLTYVPTIYIGNTPSGAGASYEGVNLLSDRVCELYRGDGNTTFFKTHLEPTGNFELYTKKDDGEWKRVEMASYSSGGVTFTNAPSAPAVSGEDNVKIVYKFKSQFALWQQIAGCKNFCVFGVGGNRDRLFLSGNVANPGEVYYSHIDNPLYFCDLDYIKVGDSETDVCSLAYYGSHLAVITDDGIYTVIGSQGQSGAIKQDALFLIDGFVATPRPIENEPSLIFGGEPVYLTDDGVYAVSASGVLDERCAALRSSRINTLLKEENLNDCRMIVYGDRLVISNAKDRLYLLDSRQFFSAQNQPFASKQYEGFVWTNIDAKTMWMQDGILFFSNTNGVFAFDGGFADEVSADEFVPIDAYWETPYLYGADLSDFKFFEKISLLCDGGEGDYSNVKIFARIDNAPWRVVKNYDAKMRLFCYADFDYSLFTYRDYVYNYVISSRLFHKKGMGIKLKFQNDRVNEPFTMLRFGVDYLTM